MSDMIILSRIIVVLCGMNLWVFLIFKNKYSEGVSIQLSNISKPVSRFCV